MKSWFVNIALTGLIICSCSKNNDKAYAEALKATMIKDDTAAFVVSYSEVYPEDGKPVYLKFSISSVQRYSNSLLLENNIKVKDGTLTVDIENIRNMGACPDFSIFSSKPPAKVDKTCAAYGTSLAVDLKRGDYNFSMQFLGEEIAKGSLLITDQTAKLEIDNGSKIKLITNQINIIPDSCIFGHFHTTGKFSAESLMEFKKCNKTVWLQGDKTEYRKLQKVSCK